MRRALLVLAAAAALLAVPARTRERRPGQRRAAHAEGLLPVRRAAPGLRPRGAAEDGRRGERARLPDPRRADPVHRATWARRSASGGTRRTTRSSSAASSPSSTRNRLLVVQPSGFGFYNHNKPVAKEQRVLAKVPVGKTPAELTQSATAAVRALAASEGVVLPEVSSGGGHDWRDRADHRRRRPADDRPDRPLRPAPQARPSRAHPARTVTVTGLAQSPRCRAITMRCTSFVPSPISRIFWSR